MKFTKYFLSIRQRPDRSVIKEEWIQFAIDSPAREFIQKDGRIRRWAAIAEMEGRYLESVPTLLGIDSDTLSVLPYYSSSKFIKEDDHVGTGRIYRRSYRRNHAY